MKLVCTRKHFFEHCTIGELTCDGEFECFILEDKVRQPEGETYDGLSYEDASALVAKWKVQHETAIPAGLTFEVVIDESSRFGRPMPHLLNVPGFSGIRFHKGNDDHDTDGCPLVGAAYNLGETIIHKSAIAFDALLPRLEAALKAGEKVTWEVR